MAKAKADPVNSEQLEALEATADPAQTRAAPGPSVGELEERAAVAEERAEAAERQVASFAEEMRILKEQMAALMRGARSPQQRPDAVAADVPSSDQPLFEPDRPHGVILGDLEVAYEQDGHQFAHDRAYVRTLKHHGAGRPFNPRLVGVVKPRPGQTLSDALDGFRDQ